MKEFNERLREVMKTMCFCYAKAGGQGFVDQQSCPCYANGENTCEAYHDHERFHHYFGEREGVLRKDIIEEMKPAFQDSTWWKENVEE